MISKKGKKIQIKSTLRLHYYRIKPLWHVENVIMMINNAAMSFNLSICTKRKQKLHIL